MFSPHFQTLQAGGTINANTAVKFGADEKKVVACGAGERAIGVAMSDAASGESVEVAIFGAGAKLKLGGTVALGQIIKSDASGQGVKAAAEGDWCFAIAMKAGVSGDLIPVQMQALTAHAAES